MWSIRGYLPTTVISSWFVVDSWTLYPLQLPYPPVQLTLSTRAFEHFPYLTFSFLFLLAVTEAKLFHFWKCSICYNEISQGTYTHNRTVDKKNLLAVCKLALSLRGLHLLCQFNHEWQTVTESIILYCILKC